MHFCTYVLLYVRMHVCTYVCGYVCMYIPVYVCMYVCMHAYMHECMYVCTYVCMYARAFHVSVCKQSAHLSRRLYRYICPSTPSCNVTVLVWPLAALNPEARPQEFWDDARGAELVWDHLCIELPRAALGDRTWSWGSLSGVHEGPLEPAPMLPVAAEAKLRCPRHVAHGFALPETAS